MIKISQIGAGEWGKNLIRTFSSLPNCKMNMVCDQNPDVVQSLTDQYHGRIRGTLDLNEIFDDAETQGVIIASLPDTHAALAMRALESGKHVFVEKPLALNISDAHKMIELSEKYKKILMVGHLLLYHPAIRELKAYIESGQLGDIYYLYSTRVNLGRIRTVENALWSLTTHDISVSMYLLEQLPIEVTATGSAYLKENVEDVVFVNLRFKNEVISHIHASWLDPHKVRKFTIVGSKQMAVFDDMEASGKLRFYDKGVERQKSGETYETFLTLRHGDIHIPWIDMREPLKLECQHFIDCIELGKEPVSGAKNGLDVLKVLSAAQESLECYGKPIKI
ncbi:MAG: hypothetical protein A3G92_03870 [Deltaproteobacteria bacterium RIFCSPLOWO2_12_FULL_38_8]|nr:MAG: hypothetical protein A3G92_03870 [Deltaproteobacteria bacterium RIFCSPLOWO2_12_FULL_38_8]